MYSGEGEPAELGGDPPGAGVKACLLSNLAGLDDADLGGYNLKAHQGLLDAERKLGVETMVVEPSSSGDFEGDIVALIDEGCDLIVTVGFLMRDVTREMAEEHPDQRFAIIDVAIDPPLDNLLNLTFATEEPAFLVGYLAAGMTRTGTVGAAAGHDSRGRADGFERGVDRHNDEKGTEVEAITDVFDENEHDFGITPARDWTQRVMIPRGADILLPGGPALVQAEVATVAEEAGGLSVIWVGPIDGCTVDPDHCDRYLASILTNVDVAVLQAIGAMVDDAFGGGTSMGTLENGGVSLLVHDTHNRVSDDLKEEIETLRQAVVAGEITP